MKQPLGFTLQNFDYEWTSVLYNEGIVVCYGLFHEILPKPHTWVTVWIMTDHAPLPSLINFKGIDNLFMKWILEMQSYLPWECVHMAGRFLVIPGALSHVR